jgi:hypothetical protein
MASASLRGAESGRHFSCSVRHSCALRAPIPGGSRFCRWRRAMPSSSSRTSRCSSSSRPAGRPVLPAAVSGSRRRRALQSGSRPAPVRGPATGSSPLAEPDVRAGRWRRFAPRRCRGRRRWDRAGRGLPEKSMPQPSSSPPCASRRSSLSGRRSGLRRCQRIARASAEAVQPAHPDRRVPAAGSPASAWSISAFNSSVESCNSRIDCCNCGVNARCCESLSWRPCFILVLYILKCSPR